MSETKNTVNLRKMSMIELKDTLHREKLLLQNRIIRKLPDKGESIKRYCDLLEKELTFREDLKAVEESIDNLSLTYDKHTQKLCDIDRNLSENSFKERYKPYATLNRVKEVKPDSKIFKIMEDCTVTNKPTKEIPLSESLHILKKQDRRLKEEQMKNRQQRFLEKLEKEESEEYHSESEGSEHDYGPDDGDGDTK